MTTIVQLGNPSPKNSFWQPEGNEAKCDCCGKTDMRHEAVEGPLVTTWSCPDVPKGEEGHYSLIDKVKSICEKDGAWQNHTWDDNPTPLWVWSNDPALEMVLASQFDCPTGRPDDFVPMNEQKAAARQAEQDQAEAAAQAEIAAKLAAPDAPAAPPEGV